MFELQHKLLGLIGSALSFQWKKASNGSLPLDAVVGGYENGYNLYVCRAFQDGEWMSGKLHEKFYRFFYQ